MISVLWALAPAAFAPPIPFLCILSRCGWRCGSWLALSWPTTPRSTLACRGEYSEAPRSDAAVTAGMLELLLKLLCDKLEE